MKKKGAIELSMQTIVIVVISVTLLVLGLIFVGGMFKKLEKIADVAFDEADRMLRQLYEGTDVPISTLPGEYLEINTKDYNTLYVWVSNQQQESKACTVKLLVGGISDMVDIPATELKTDTLYPGDGVTKEFRIKASSTFPYKKEKLIQVESDCGESGTATTEVYLLRATK